MRLVEPVEAVVIVGFVSLLWLFVLSGVVLVLMFEVGG